MKIDYIDKKEIMDDSIEVSEKLKDTKLSEMVLHILMAREGLNVSEKRADELTRLCGFNVPKTDLDLSNSKSDMDLLLYVAFGIAKAEDNMYMKEVTEAYNRYKAKAQVVLEEYYEEACGSINISLDKFNVIKEKSKILGEEVKFTKIAEAKLNKEERDKLPDEMFGIRKDRKYPLHDKGHVSAAIRFFNSCPKKDMEELATNIAFRIEELDMDVTLSTDITKYIDKKKLKELIG